MVWNNIMWLTKQTLSRIKISIAQFGFLQLTLELMMDNKDEVKNK